MHPRLTICLILLITLQLQVGKVYGQNKLVGTYNSRDNEFERYSIITLEDGNRFVYRYAVGGCQGEVHGTWSFENKRLRFANDPEFRNNTVIKYPDLSLTLWKVKKFGIKPNDSIDTGCILENGLHIKQ